MGKVQQKNQLEKYKKWKHPDRFAREDIVSGSNRWNWKRRRRTLVPCTVLGLGFVSVGTSENRRYNISRPIQKLHLGSSAKLVWEFTKFRVWRIKKSLAKAQKKATQFQLIVIMSNVFFK